MKHAPHIAKREIAPGEFRWCVYPYRGANKPFGIYRYKATAFIVAQQRTLHERARRLVRVA